MKRLGLAVYCGALCVQFVFCYLPHDADNVHSLPLASQDPASKEERVEEALRMERSGVDLPTSSHYSKEVGEVDIARKKRSGVDLFVSSSHLEVGRTLRIKQSRLDYFASSNCTVHDTQPGQDLTRIVNTQKSEHSFFFKPLSGFRSLVFRMVVNNRIDFSGSYEWPRKRLVVHGYELGEDSVGMDGWLPVYVEYYRHRVSGATDKLALRVSVGTTANLTKNLITRNRWTHEYKGFTAYIEGRASYSFGCYPSDGLLVPTVHLPHSQQVSTPNSRVDLSTVPAYSREVTEVDNVKIKRSGLDLSALPSHYEEMQETSTLTMKSSGLDFFASPNCSIQETQPGDDLTRIFSSSKSEHSFFFKPLPGFGSLMFRMIVDGRIDFGGPYEWTEQSLVVHGYELGEDTVGRDGWLPVKVEYYRHRVPAAMDSLALRVSVGTTGNLTRSLITHNRWTHEFKGFIAYVEGRASYSFGCYPSGVLPDPSIRLRHSQQMLPAQDSLMVGGVVGGGLLLVLIVMVIVLLLRRRNQDGPPAIPKQLPMEMLLRQAQVSSEPEPTYEEFDEETLAKLRRKLDPENLGGCDEERAVLEAPHIIKGKIKGFQGPCRSGGDVDGGRDLGGACGGADYGGKDSRAVENVYENAGTLRLLEEKERVWKEDPELGQAPQDHYVEMHGIVSRTSSLNK